MRETAVVVQNPSVPLNTSSSNTLDVCIENREPEPEFSTFTSDLYEPFHFYTVYIRPKPESMNAYTVYVVVSNINGRKSKVSAWLTESLNKIKMRSSSYG